MHPEKLQSPTVNFGGEGGKREEQKGHRIGMTWQQWKLGIFNIKLLCTAVLVLL
jgi:hypothetical protein